MSTHVVEQRARGFARLPRAARAQLEWLAFGLVFAFAMPFVLADQVGIPRDLYYGVYAASVVLLFASWAWETGQPLGAMLRTRWVTATALGLAFGGLLSLVVLRAADATARPGGATFVAEVFWRGGVYGLADGLLLSSFPILAVFAAFQGTRLRERLRGKIAIGALALVASLTMTAVYHAGYSDFRSSKLRSPVVGDVMWSAPTLVTLNPIGAPIAHAAMHVTAVMHSYDTDLFLPPHG